MAVITRQDVTAPAPVGTELRGAALWITLQRPDSLNALSPEMFDGLEAAMREAREDDRVRCVVLTGSGRAFCSGADLELARSLVTSREHLDAFVLRAREVIEQIAHHPQPVIAAVNGAAIAGGLELLLACDIVIVSERAVIADGHATFGLFPGAGGSARLPRRVGEARALRALLTGEPMSLEELHSAGLVSEIVAAEELEAAVTRVADVLSARSPRALRLTKEVVRGTFEGTFEQAMEHELAACRQQMLSADAAEGLAAFDEKRAPHFACDTDQEAS